MSKLVIVGSGGHARVVMESIFASKFVIIGLLDDFAKVGTQVDGAPVLGTVSEYLDKPQNADVFVAVGDNRARTEIVKRFPAHTYFPAIAHSKSTVSGELGQGTFVGVGANVGPGSRAGDFSIVNTHANLEHDSKLGIFCHLAPGVVTGGRVKIGNHTMVGIGAVIQDGVTIGENCIIGMGSIVTKDVPDNSVGWGQPFAIKRENRSL